MANEVRGEVSPDVCIPATHLRIRLMVRIPRVHAYPFGKAARLDAVPDRVILFWAVSMTFLSRRLEPPLGRGSTASSMDCILTSSLVFFNAVVTPG